MDLLLEYSVAGVIGGELSGKFEILPSRESALLNFSISWLEDCDSWLVASACNVNCSDLKINLSVPVVSTSEMNCSDLKIAETVQGWEGSLGEMF